MTSLPVPVPFTFNLNAVGGGGGGGSNPSLSGGSEQNNKRNSGRGTPNPWQHPTSLARRGEC
jgi:hypothetical protein